MKCKDQTGIPALLRNAGLQRQRMQRPAHLPLQRLIDQLMLLHTGFSLVLAEPVGMRHDRGGRAKAARRCPPPSPSRRARSAARRRRRHAPRSRCRRGSCRARSRRCALGGEIDRRRRALLAAADVAQIERLAEPALGLADQQDRLARGLEGERRDLVKSSSSRRRRSRASAGCRGRWSRCRARRCRTRPGSRARGRPPRCPSGSRRTGP
jgi:hypothetical protein